MPQIYPTWLAALAAAATFTSTAYAEFTYGRSWPPAWHGKHPAAAGGSFQRIATLPNYLNNADHSAETVSEIVTVAEFGNTLVYTDGVLGEVGFVDIRDPKRPQGRGKLALNGEPTSVATWRQNFVLVAVNSSYSFTQPDGYLAVIDVRNQRVVAELPLDGQPDSIAVSPDQRYAAVVIENERDEEIEVDGMQGGLPQLPAGGLVVIDTAGPPSAWTSTWVDLRGLATYAPDDPEPEFVSINHRNQALVSLQENNHLAVVDLRSATVHASFSAGEQSLSGVDITEDGMISLTDSLSDVVREPDAVAWVRSGRHTYVATANEGDLFGGSRGFSLFTPSGDLIFDSGALLDEIAVRYGHYPEHRSGNRGTEPEAIAYARFGKRDLLFVGSERGSFVAVFNLRAGQPEFEQLLPAPLGPEGIVAIPERGLLVVSGEEDAPPHGVRSSLMLYALTPGIPSYPQLVAADDEHGKPIPWSALSGMAGVPGRPGEVLAVWDGYYSESRVLNIDASSRPAVVTHSTLIVGGSGKYDPEGIAIDRDGSMWIASEGAEPGEAPNRLVQVSPEGSVLQEVALPDSIERCRAASEATATLASGFEGVALWPHRGRQTLLVAQQRGWKYTTPECEDLDDAPSDATTDEPTWTRLWVYDLEEAAWTHIAYELEPVPPNAAWVGLSEVTAVDGGFLVLERDNRSGDFAQLKSLVRLSYRSLSDGIITRQEKQHYDLRPALLRNNGWVSDKPEGVAVTADGHLYLVTDNDGVDDWSGETWFLRLGRTNRVFR